MSELNSLKNLVPSMLDWISLQLNKTTPKNIIVDLYLRENYRTKGSCSRTNIKNTTSQDFMEMEMIKKIYNYLFPTYWVERRDGEYIPRYKNEYIKNGIAAYYLNTEIAQKLTTLEDAIHSCLEHKKQEDELKRLRKRDGVAWQLGDDVTESCM